MFKRTALLAITVAATSSALIAQTAASRFALAVVTDPRGKVIVDIGADDFIVQEGSATREILDVRIADYPVVIVIDNGAAADFAMIRAGVLRLLERLGPRPIAIVTTAGTPKLVAAFEDERTTVTERLEAVEPVVDQPNRPLAASALGGETIRATGTLFAAIVVATASPSESATATAEFVAPIVDSRAVVHAVAYQREVGAPANPIQRVATETHGDYTAIYSAASFLPALDRIAARLTSELFIEYLVPVGSKPVDVRIGVKIPGARVRGLGGAPK